MCRTWQRMKEHVGENLQGSREKWKHEGREERGWQNIRGRRRKKGGMQVKKFTRVFFFKKLPPQKMDKAGYISPLKHMSPLEAVLTKLFEKLRKTVLSKQSNAYVIISAQA